jgi:pimeloyl-ACP methyl ester carboxylesterase
MKISLLFLVCMVAMATLPSFAQQVIAGTGPDGSQYEIDLPASWNHALIVYAHGIVDPAAPIQLPSENSDFAAFRDALLQQGYAVVSSSWSDNGYAEKDAAQRTHQLSAAFSSAVGSPTRTVLVGKSLGGLSVLQLAEQFPSQYDGALIMCGPVGGSSLEIKYLADARILYDHFFPGTLPGDAFHPVVQDFEPGSPAFMDVYGSLFNGFFTADQRTLQEMLISGLEAVGFNVRFGQDVLSRTHQHVPYDNTKTAYSGSFDDSTLNATVQRFTADPDAVNYVQHNYDPTGQLKIPVLTLHTLLDPVVPYSHELRYAQLTGRTASDQMLVQQSVARYDHCNFKLQEKLTALHQLDQWISDPGQKPQSGNVTIP